MSQRVIERYGPLFDCPPIKKFVENEKRKELFGRVFSVAFGVIGVVGSVAGGVVLIVTGAQGSLSVARIVSGSLLIPVGLLAFIKGSQKLFQCAKRDKYKFPTEEQALQAFNARKDAGTGKVDQIWQEWFKEKCYGYGRQCVHSILKLQNAEAPLEEPWISILHENEVDDSLSLFRRGFCRDPRYIVKKISPRDAALFFQNADLRSYINVLLCLNTMYVHKQNSVVGLCIMHTLAANPPREEEVMQKLAESLSSGFIQVMINLAARNVLGQWRKLQERQAEVAKIYLLPPDKPLQDQKKG